jgi:hypothetical protein
MRYLDDFGYVVIANAASPTEIQAQQDLLWDWIEALPGLNITRSNIDSWNNWPETIAKTGIFGGAGIGQSEALWRARCLPAVRTAFECLWKTRELFVSYDGACAYRPTAGHEEWSTLGGTASSSCGHVCFVYNLF